MDASDAGKIRSVRPFSEVGEQHFATLIQATVVRRFGPRTLVIRGGEQPEFLHVLLEGSVELFIQADHQQTTITILRPITAFILPAVVAEQPYLASARTLGAVRCLAIRGDAVRSAFDADPGFARAVVLELSRSFRRLLAELRDQKLRTSTERLADWLLRANAQLGATGRFTLPFDKRTLASRLGMTPENLSRNLKALADWGVIVNGRDVTLKDPAALADIGHAGTAGDEPEF